MSTPTPSLRVAAAGRGEPGRPVAAQGRPCRSGWWRSSGFSALGGLSGSTHVLIAARCLMAWPRPLTFPATLPSSPILHFTDARGERRRSAYGPDHRTLAWRSARSTAACCLTILSGAHLLRHYPGRRAALALGAVSVGPTSRIPPPRGLICLGFVVLSDRRSRRACLHDASRPAGRAAGCKNRFYLAGYGAGLALLAVPPLRALGARVAIRSRRPRVPRFPFSARQLSIAAAFFSACFRLHLP